MNAKQKADLKSAVAGLADVGRWAAANWKMLGFVIPAVLVFGDNLIGKAVSGKAAREAIGAIVEPIIAEQVRGARMDADSIKAMIREQGELMRQNSMATERRFDRLEYIVAQSAEAKRQYRLFEQQRRLKEESEHIRNGLFGAAKND